jgi:hypothetical protein
MDRQETSIDVYGRFCVFRLYIELPLNYLMAYSVIEFEFEKSHFNAQLYRTPDGKVQEFLMPAK